MAHDTYIPENAPGIAAYATESIGGRGDPRFGEGVPTTTTVTVPENSDFDLYHVVGRLPNGDIVPAVYGTAGGVASGALTFSGVGTANDTVTIGARVYTLVAAPDAANEVKIGASAAATAANLAAAVNGSATAITAGDVGPGTTAHADVTATVAGAVVTVTAKAAGDEANTIATTESGTNTSWGAATLTGGDDDAAVKPFGITTAPVVTLGGERTTIDVYRKGHWDMDALVWHASFDTDAKKKQAFEGSLSPNIFVSKKKYASDAITI